MSEEIKSEVTQNEEVPAATEQENPVLAAQEELKERAVELTEEQIKKLNSLKYAADWKDRLIGKRELLATPKKKVSKSWHNGQLISTEERNKLSWKEVHASNNQIGNRNK